MQPPPLLEPHNKLRVTGGNEEELEDEPPPLIDRGEDSDSDSDFDPDEEEDEFADPDRDLDLLGQEEHEADTRLIGVYGDTIHRNDGRKLHGGIVDDAAMQFLWDKVVSYPHPLYSPPKGKVGNQFLEMFVDKLRKVRMRETNSEMPVIFSPCILRREPGVMKAKAIRKLILRRLEQWNQGKFPEMVQEIVNIARSGAGGGRKEENDDSIACTYHSMVIDGGLRAATRWLTNRDGEGG